MSRPDAQLVLKFKIESLTKLSIFASASGLKEIFQDLKTSATRVGVNDVATQAPPIFFIALKSAGWQLIVKLADAECIGITNLPSSRWNSCTYQEYIA